MADLNSAIGASGGGGAGGGGQRPDIARLMQLHAQAQAGQAASIASLVNGPPGLPGLPPGALGLPPGLQGLPPGLNIPTSLSSSLLQGLPTSLSSSLGGLGPNPLHPALSMLKPQMPDPKKEDELRKSLSESNGKSLFILVAKRRRNWGDCGLNCIVDWEANVVLMLENKTIARVARKSPGSNVEDCLAPKCVL